ncbi:MAG: hypothetical protein CL778_01505 [Chloroflexi bacterium]|nr:hypothetical protein [Chloroflexota bacterium]|tara:strand:+ start:8350 stop:9198 length:849 start_codon:yes stop_codon:yes gene_type:complete
MIIDSLTHILPKAFENEKNKFLKKDRIFNCLFSNSTAKISSVSDLYKSMTQSEVDKSVIAGFGWTDISLAKLSNDYNLESANNSKGKLIPLCSINPIWGKSAIIELRRCYELGAKGVGELHLDTQGIFDNNLNCMDEIMDFTLSYNMPTIIHGSEPLGHLYPGKGITSPEKIIKIIQKYPKNIFIFSHFGGGLPFYSLMPEIKCLLENTFFDSAAFPYLYDSKVFKVSSIALGENKILFASDFPVTTQMYSLKKFSEVSLNNMEKKSILSVNADNIYSKVVN